MNRDQFHQYMSKPVNLDKDSLLELENILDEYPYFQAARMLYVRNLKNLDNIKFNKQLKRAAAFINNRQFLFGLLNDIGFDESGSFFPLNLDYQLDKESKDISPERTVDLLALADESREINSRAGVDNLTQYAKSFYVQELEKFIPVADLDLLLFDFPVEDTEVLDFDFDNKFPEIDPGGITTRGIIEQFVHHDIESNENEKEKEKEKVKDKETSDKSRKMELIDDFIKANPKMPQPPEPGDESKDISLDSLEESDGIMTETLAEIYLKQGYHYKALSAYEKLSLKYPEKSIYFASQIQKIKRLISNQ